MPRRSNVSAAIAVVFIYLVFAECSDHSTAAPACSRQCIAENCNSMAIRYGKYCGVDYTGCPGEKPCDDLDDCCQRHDDCVTKNGMANVKCHKTLKTCLTRVQKSGKVGFSKECPYSTAAPTMIHGMDLGIMMSQLGNSFGSMIYKM